MGVVQSHTHTTHLPSLPTRNPPPMDKYLIDIHQRIMDTIQAPRTYVSLGILAALAISYHPIFLFPFLFQIPDLFLPHTLLNQFARQYRESTLRIIYLTILVLLLPLSPLISTLLIIESYVRCTIYTPPSPPTPLHPSYG